MTDMPELASMVFSGRPRAQLLDMVPKFRWVHAIDLGDGAETPGVWGKGNPSITEALADIDWRNKKVLDVGCWDGMYSFYAEARGAFPVYATDLITQRDFSGQPTFQLAHAIRNSRILYYPNVSVYNVEVLGIRDFDVVIFSGVYYHLKDPVRALTALRRVMKEGAIIIVEGAVLEDVGCFAKFYYKDHFCGDKSNWWVPTVNCLRQWVECSFLRIVREYERWGHMENQRHTLAARAVVQNDPLYSKVPEELEEYHV
ncbi:MAG: DUF1698 domain-containing protein [Alphaproteobacteria bacterium]|nr:DUF1698 domain-containing protein [Alphaproteobacteria bacterium]